MDVEDYLILDSTSKHAKYEYLDGKLLMLAGGSNDHSIIAMNIGSLLHLALRKSPCTVYSSDVRVKLSESKYVHPDITVGCDERDSATHTLQYPRIVVEVLSPSTEAFDRSEKRFAYLNCSTLEEYILVDSRKRLIEVYHREKNQWTSVIYQPDDTIFLKSIQVEMLFEDIYAKTRNV